MPKLTQRTIDALPSKETRYEVPDKDATGLYVRVERTGAKAFYLRYRLNGRPQVQRLGRVGELPLTRAREMTREIRAQATAHEAGRAESPKPTRKERQKMPTLAEWVDTYAAAVLTHKRSGKATLERLRLHFTPFMPMRLDDPDMLKHVMLWRDSRLHAGIRPKTINRDISCLSACFGEAVARGIIEDSPLRRLRPLKEENEIRVRFLSPSEEERLYAALEAREERIREGRASANAWREERGYATMTDLRAAPFADFVRPLVILLLNTGLRRGEALRLHWKDIDFERRMLTVTAQGSKTGKPRHVPMNSVLVDTLERWASMGTHEGLVFPNPATGGTLTHFRRSWAGILKAAGIVDFRTHDTRHHFASRLVQAGVPLNTVRELLGHASLQMTMRYAHLAPEHGLAAVELLAMPKGGIVPFPGMAKK